MVRLLASAAVALALSGCGGVALSSKSGPVGSDPAFLNYGLPRAYFALTAKVDKDGAVTLSMTDKPVYVRDPDPKNNFRLTQHHAWYTSEMLTVQTDGGGLLNAVNATSENQAVAIVNQALVLSGQIAPVMRPKREGVCEREKSASVAHALDPLDQNQIDGLNKALGKDGVCLRVVVRPIENVSDALAACANCSEGNGVFYRVLRSYRMDVFDTTAVPAAPPDISLVFSAPDVKHTYYMPLERKWFVKFDVKLAFDRGVLTKFESSRPSQALAALQLPVDVIKNILGLSTASSSSAVSKTK